MIIARFACYTLHDQLSKLQGTLPDLHRKDCTGGGGGLGFMSAPSMGSNRGFYLSSALQKSNASSCLSCLLARGLFKQFEIKRCLLLVVQTFMIPHKAHICTAGIAHWRSGTKDLNDLTENGEKGDNFNIYCTQTSTSASHRRL